MATPSNVCPYYEYEHIGRVFLNNTPDGIDRLSGGNQLIRDMLDIFGTHGCDHADPTIECRAKSNFRYDHSLEAI